ncbi:MAG TPA: ABC transporter ATP-binding protein [bacterium]|nr:ABC transporter ATP-binding protein [bacterium]
MSASATQVLTPAPMTAQSSPALVQVVGLGRTFGERQALRDISFSVRPGERLALLGPNGSGKSTLLRILATMLKPSAGAASIDGLDVQRQSAQVRKRLGTVFQSPSLDGKLSVRENLRFQGYLFGLSGQVLRQRIEEVLARFNLDERGQDRVETLSGGLKRRVELAKTLLHRPRLLLLDEPSTGLDPAARLDFWDVVLALQEERELALVVATHLLDEADRCHQVLMLDQGRLVAADTPEALKAQVGGVVVTLETAEPARLSRRLLQECGIKSREVGGLLHLEGAHDLEAAARLQRQYPREISALRIGRPTLEDVFLALTGRSLEPGNSAEGGAS